jgi:hypothetical protein
VKATWWCLLLVGLAGGCFSPRPGRDMPAQPIPDQVAPPGAARPVRPVTAEQVSQVNAHAKANALAEELDREAPAACPACGEGPGCTCNHKPN